MCSSKKLTVRDIVNNENFDCNSNYAVCDCTTPGSYWDTSPLVYVSNGSEPPPEDVLNMEISYITSSNCMIIIEAKKGKTSC